MPVPILGMAECSSRQAATWAASRGAPPYWCELADLVWEVAVWARPDVMWAQACKETGFGRFLRPDGTPSPATNRSMHNPCGLKNPAGGSNDSPHFAFYDWVEGFIAQRDHLNLYARAPGYPRVRTPDPRHFPALLGRATTVEALSGNWAGAGYGESILANFLTPCQAFRG